MQIVPLDSETLRRIFQQLAPLHASSLFVSESVDLEQAARINAGLVAERSPARFAHSSFSQPQSDLLFLAASDWPGSMKELLLYLAGLASGGIALVEMDAGQELSPPDLRLALQAAGMRQLFAGPLKKINQSLQLSIQIPAAYLDHPIRIIEKLPGQYPGHPETRVAIIADTPAVARDWIAFTETRGLQGRLQIFGPPSLGAHYDRLPYVHAVGSDFTLQDQCQGLPIRDAFARSVIAQMAARSYLFDVRCNAHRLPSRELLQLFCDLQLARLHPDEPGIWQARGCLVQPDTVQIRDYTNCRLELWNYAAARHFFLRDCWHARALPARQLGRNTTARTGRVFGYPAVVQTL
ncbi:MAG: hypothetical protein KDK39_10860 [Leptospiraceae bacterium]|nr:hypothetical protein [Leptospiraceae bacterium]